ncbi:unnamed protein product, partial [Hapterophycus canaliculatus]
MEPRSSLQHGGGVPQPAPPDPDACGSGGGVAARPSTPSPPPPPFPSSSSSALASSGGGPRGHAAVAVVADVVAAATGSATHVAAAAAAAADTIQESGGESGGRGGGEAPAYYASGEEGSNRCGGAGDLGNRGTARLRVPSRAARLAAAGGTREGRLQPGIMFPNARRSVSVSDRLRRCVEQAEDVTEATLSKKFMLAL